jgi:hypothetical protein
MVGMTRVNAFYTEICPSDESVSRSQGTLLDYFHRQDSLLVKKKGASGIGEFRRKEHLA